MHFAGLNLDISPAKILQDSYLDSSNLKVELYSEHIIDQKPCIPKNVGYLQSLDAHDQITKGVRATLHP